MDSLSQIGLGAAVAVATMGRRTAPWKAALWGAVAGTLPDLDVFIDHGDAIRNMVLHRAQSHAPFWLTLLSLPFAALVARLHGEQAQWRRWWFALWLALVTHPLLDAMTVYGTQLGLPFTDYPYGVGSMFIIDPLYTLPLLVGVFWALVAQRSPSGLRANVAGLVLSTAYLGWSALAQQHVTQVARSALQVQGIPAAHLLVTPSPFNTVLWRVLVMNDTHYHEGFYSLLDATPQIRFDRFDRGATLDARFGALEGRQRIAAFSHGYYKLHEADGQVLLTDLRMGQEPFYSFTFPIAEAGSGQPLPVPESVGQRHDPAVALPWLWRRLQGELLPPPR